ncbi:MAG: LptF/LptG family permease [Puniceicoccales bacterium]|jgi:lipopolysaccharide export system permease protein|nr:LptF/LptG family permease [Puniceicoccales bacterium]
MRLGRYVCNEWLKYMGITLMATLALLVFEDMYREFPGLLSAGTGSILRHYFYLLPHFFCTILPISVFVSALMSLCHLRDNNEFVAMQSIGMSPGQITKNLWIWGAALSALMILLQTHLDEWSRDDNYHGVAYRDGQSGRLWLIGRLNAKTGHAEDIFVWNPGPPTHRFRAQSAQWDGSRWCFEGATESSVIEMEQNHRLTGEKSCNEFHETPRQLVSQQKRPKDMCLRELRQALRWESQKSSHRSALEVRFYALHMACLGPLVALFCAIPFSLRGVRQNPTIGASKAVGILFLFHVLTGLSHSLGNNEIFHPIAAAGLPFLLPIFIGTMRVWQLASPLYYQWVYRIYRLVASTRV